jgi:hypothetical protein
VHVYTKIQNCHFFNKEKALHLEIQAVYQHFVPRNRAQHVFKASSLLRVQSNPRPDSLLRISRGRKKHKCTGHKRRQRRNVLSVFEEGQGRLCDWNKEGKGRALGGFLRL